MAFVEYEGLVDDDSQTDVESAESEETVEQLPECLSPDDAALLRHVISREQQANKMIEYAQQALTEVHQFKRGVVSYFNQKYSLQAKDQLDIAEGRIIRALVEEEPAD